MVCSLFALYLDCLQVSLYGDFVYTDNETLQDVPTNTVGARGENKERGRRELRRQGNTKDKERRQVNTKGKRRRQRKNEEKGETRGEATAEGKGKRKARGEASANRQDPLGNVETEKTTENEFADRVSEGGKSYKRWRGKGSQKKKCKGTKH